MIPESFMTYKEVLVNSFPSAMRIGAENGADGEHLLIASAQDALVEGMVGSCYITVAVAILTAIIVWTMMPDEQPQETSSEE